MAAVAAFDARTQSSRASWIIAVTVLLGMIMAIIDATIVNVALDNIAGNLGASIDDAAWVATGYILASVITMPLNGWLTAYFGRKNYYAGCIALFTVASFFCGTARNIWQLTFYRIIQGFGGGALQPTAQAILFETFPPAERGSAMALFGIGAMVGPALGPILGGYIVDNATWPLIFFINLPIGVVAFVMTMAFIPNPSYIVKPKGGPDWLGLGLLATGLGSLQYVLERGQHDDWFSSRTIVLLTFTSAITLAWFLFKTLRDKHPLVDLKVFRFPVFTVANVLVLVTGFGLFGTSLIMPLFFQTMLGMTAFDTGMALLPGAIATAVCMVIVGRLMNKVDARILVGIGTTLFAWSCWQLGYLDQTAGYWDIFYPRMFQGVALAFLFVPMTTVMLAPIPRAELAGATGVSMLLRQLGGGLGIAILTTLLARETAIAWSALAGGVTQSHGMTSNVLTQLVQQQSTLIAYDYLFRLCGIVFLFSLPFVFFMRGKKAQGGPPPQPAMAMD